MLFKNHSAKLIAFWLLFHCFCHKTNNRLSAPQKEEQSPDCSSFFLPFRDDNHINTAHKKRAFNFMREQGGQAVKIPYKQAALLYGVQHFLYQKKIFYCIFKNVVLSYFYQYGQSDYLPIGSYVNTSGIVFCYNLILMHLSAHPVLCDSYFVIIKC